MKGEFAMRLQCHFIALALALTPVAAAAQPVSWQRYCVPETGAVVDIPTQFSPKTLENRKQDMGGAF
jgi:hypothetical protein